MCNDRQVAIVGSWGSVMLGFSCTEDTENCVEHASESSHQRMGMLGYLSASSYFLVFEDCPWRCILANSMALENAHIQQRDVAV